MTCRRTLLRAFATGLLWAPLAGVFASNAIAGSTPAAPMTTARYLHAATLLPNGKVLVSGGSDSDGILIGAEIYDPPSDKWTVIGNMTSVREWHVAALRPDGVAIVQGGFTFGLAGTTEFYDAASDSWHALAAGQNRRYAHAAAWLPGAKLLVSGGGSDAALRTALFTTEIYDAAADNWTDGERMIIARFRHTATTLPGGTVLVAGGADTSDTVLGGSEIYDLATRAWHASASMATPRHWHAATALQDGRVLVVGGVDRDTNVLSSVEIYDPVSGVWTRAVAGLATARQRPTATLLPNGKVLVAGGLDSDGTVLSSAELYVPDPSTGSGPVDVVEYHWAARDHYFVSADPAEIAALDAAPLGGWTRTDQAFKAYAQATAGTSPVCRFYIPAAWGDSHYFSASPAECSAVRTKFPMFVYETPTAFHLGLPDAVTGACPAGFLPVYRLWDNRADTNHRYTTSVAIRDQMLGKGYIGEGYGPDAVSMCAPR